MRNRLTFPTAGMETKYVWDRHNIQNNGIYKWNKHNIINEVKHYWDKYSTNQDVKYYWKQYEKKQKTTYNWYRYSLNTIDSTYASNNYIQYVYQMKQKTKYLNLNKNLSSTPVSKATHTITGTYVYLYKADNTYVRYSVADVKKNCFTCNPLYYGFVGVSENTSYSYPYHYFTPDTKMYVDANNNNYLTFSNLYNTTRNISNKPTGLTDSPTGSYYIELNMMWPDFVKQIYSFNKATTNLTNKFTNNTYSVLYDMLNDGFWRKDSNAVGRQYKDDSSRTQVTSAYENTYPIGISGDYLYTTLSPTVEIIKGNYIQDVYSTDENAYPHNTYQGDYWYEKSSPPSYYLWDKYEIEEKPTWSVYTAEQKARMLIEYGDVRNTNAYGIASKTDLGEWSEENAVYLYNISGNEIITLYGKNNFGGKQIYFDEEEYTMKEFAELVERVTQDGYNFSCVTFVLGFSIYDKTYTFTGWDADYGVFTISENTDNTFNLKAHSHFDVNVLSTPKALSREKGTFGYELFSSFDPPSSETFPYQYPLLLVTTPKLPVVRSNQYYSDTGYIVNYNDYNPLQNSVFKNVLYNKNNNLPFPLIQNDWGTNTDYFYVETSIYGKQSANFAKYLEEPELIDNEYFKGTLLDTITDTNPNAYPKDGYLNGYWYVYEGIKKYKGELIGTIKSDVNNTYPEGIQDGYWFEYKGYGPYEDIQKADYIGEVESLNKNDYPEDSYQGQYWYIYKGSKLFQYLGSLIETVNAETVNAYPKNGIKIGYWYIYQGYENNGPYKSRLVDEVETNQSNTYPLDGIQGDYWYVYKKSYDGYKLQINDWQIKGGVNYKHNINPENDFTIGCVASAEIDFDYDNTADDFQQYLDADYCDYWTWQPEDSTWRLMGRFWLTDAEYNRNLVKVKAFDAIFATDAYVDEFIANTTYPISVTDFFNNICQLLGVTGRINSSLANTTFSFQDNFEAINITARQLLQYIAEATGGFIKIEPDGTLYLTTYSSSGKILDNSNYTSYAKQRYTVEPISGLTVKMNSDDLGVSSGDVENNPYIIENNPLFYTQSDEEITDAVYRLYNSINDKVYRPATIELLQDFGINCGDIITINGDTFYVMSKELSASGCKLECFGNQYRDKKAQSINSDIVALRGKTNELYRDLEMTQSTLTDRANGLQSQITQTAEEINLRVTNEVEGLESQITQTAEQISTRVTNEVAGLESKITQTADSITSSVTDEINQAKSEIKQTTDSISLEVQNQGDLVAQLVLDVDGISAKGYVTFTDLAGSGKTTINGDNITTGTISADRINLTGAISWGDLTQSCKNTIASYAGDSDLPDYIHSTYIDATTIKSPTIQGGTLYAGNVWEGYCRMTSSGLNVVSDTGGNICGIGWHPGYYNLPYVVLGSGVDNVGTDQGLIKKYTHGIWIGDSDSIFASNEQVPTSGTGIFVDFVEGKIYKYINGTKTQL